MPGGEAIRLGPFIGGLNTASDPTAIADAELTHCVNFEFEIDGSLISRPPLKEIEGSTTFTERIICLADVVFSGTHYLIASNTNGVFHYSGGVWTLITNTFQATAAIQYTDFVYLIAKTGSANPGGKWSPGGGFTAIAAMPKGAAAAIHKERLYVVPGVAAISNGSRLTFSNVGNFDTWTGSDFIDITPGDGTNLVDLTVFQDNLLLFKEFSSHVLAYDVRPTDAVRREISKTIGVNKQFCVVNYENQVYIFSGGFVYEIINYDFNRLNAKVPFVRDDTAPVGTSLTSEAVFISLLEDRLVCRYYNKIYVFGLRTRTWTQWESQSDYLHYFGPIVTMRLSTGNEYYAGTCASTLRSLIQLYNKVTATTKEQSLFPASTVEDTFSRTVSNGWGTSDSGHAWTLSGGSASDYSTNGASGLVSLGVVASSRVCQLAPNFTNVDVSATIKTSVVAAGNSQTATILIRYSVSGGLENYYAFRILLKTTGQFALQVFKSVAGAITVLGTSADLGAYTSSTVLKLRTQVNGTTVRGKLWNSSSNEPIAWTSSFTDSDVSVTGKIWFLSQLETGNSNSLPVVFTWDNIQVGDMADVVQFITTFVQTKNFDMAIPNQFKRLWSWGADLSTNNPITGIATPIVASFTPTWGDLEAYIWDALITWDQPLTTPASVVTVAPTGTGTARRFARFMKALRYRQINFGVQLTTDGSTGDGPARLYTMTITTESKQHVGKAVS